MRISHAELEDCLRDPASWVATKFDASTGGPRGGYDYCLREGIYRFHKIDDSSEARRYLEQSIINRKLINRLRIENTLERFDAYVYWFRNSGVIVADHRARLNLELGPGLTLGGVVSRLDITSSGYRAILLNRIRPSWQEETRMRLIQRGMARKYGRSEEEFTVGYQELDASNLEATSYSQEELDEAEETSRQLAEEILVEVLKYT
jgi:hypothetical protein